MSRGVTLPRLDLTLPSPAENLAADEVLLDRGAPGALRFWESSHHFVVLGYGNRAAEEVHLDACRTHDVPVLRRCSGGGTVLQGPGCLNYSLVLPMDEAGPLASITGANQFIMERNRAALAALLGRPVTVEGHTDLALNGRKFSGNAQRRRRDWLLFHGTFLLDFDFTKLGQFLRPPPRQPVYRQGRRHEEFITGLGVPRESLQAALVNAWQADGPPAPLDLAATRTLAEGRYRRDEWNFSR